MNIQFVSRNHRQLVVLVVAMALFISALTPVPSTPTAHAAPAPSQNTSPASLLNPDGTLRLDGSFSGSLDLSGWNVQLDPSHGPVLKPTCNQPAAPSTDGQWSNLGSGLQALNGAVNTIVVTGTDVYIGGDFTDASGLPAADYIVKWNGSASAWSALGKDLTGDGSLNGSVYAIAVSGSSIYVGGAFADVNNSYGEPALHESSYIARWDAPTGYWSAVGNNSLSGHPSINNTVYAIAVSEPYVYVGGAFTDVNDSGAVLNAADYIVRWNTLSGSWSALGSNGASNGSLNMPVRAIAAFWTDVYVGGDFYNVNNSGTVLTKADYIARWNGSNWWALSSDGANNGSLNNSVYALAFGGVNLYVGGAFTYVRNGSRVLGAADYIAKWDGANWSALGSDGAGHGSLNNVVRAIAASGSTVYAGGNFTDVNNSGTVLTAADRIAKFNSSTSAWSALGGNGTGNGSVNNTVSAIALDGSNVDAGGVFTDLNNAGTPLSAANFIAMWNGSAWSAPAATPPQGAIVSISGNSPQINAIAVSGTDVYVGGNFTDIENGATAVPAADFVAKWDTLTGHWSALGGSGAGDGSLNGSVKAIAVSGSYVYVGGTFTNVNNNGAVLAAADYVAKFDTLTGNWSALGHNGAGNGSLSLPVNAIATVSSNVYVGGSFTDVNNKGTVLTAADYIARFDGTNWSALGSTSALNSSVYALAVDGSSNLYVGGAFTDVNNSGTVLGAADYIARWNGSAWSALGSNGAGNGSLNSYVNAIAASGANVYAVGYFTNVNNNGTVLGAADYIAKWDAVAANWSALGSNGGGDGSLNNNVFAIAVSGPNVYVGGYFTDVRNNVTALYTADYIAQWDALTGNWSALGSNGAALFNDGSLNNPVLALATIGTDVYAGGKFVNVNNNGTVLAAADYIAMYGAPGPSNAALSNLALSNGTLNPAFVVGTLAYTANVMNNVTSLTATPTTADANATVTVNGSTVTSGSASGAINLNVGSNLITVIVTAPDGATTKTYTITATRAAQTWYVYLPLVMR